MDILVLALLSAFCVPWHIAYSTGLAPSGSHTVNAVRHGKCVVISTYTRAHAYTHYMFLSM